MDHAKMPEEPNEMCMNINHGKQEENFEFNGMILQIQRYGVELQDSWIEHRNIGDGRGANDDDDDDDEEDSLEEDQARDVPLDVAVPIITISEDDISRIYDEPDWYVLREEDQKPSAPKAAASHGSFLTRIRGLMGERGRAYKVFTRHGRERFEI